MKIIKFLLLTVLLMGLSISISSAATRTTDGITLTYPDVMTDCNPTFNFLTTGVDPTWEVRYEIFRDGGGELILIGSGTTYGDLDLSFTPEPLLPGESRYYAIFIGVFGPDVPIKMGAKWMVNCDEPCCGGQGCTPGFWKNHPEVWPIDTSILFDAIFGRDAHPTLTMLEAMDLRGGGLNALSRHAAAAYLNAISPDVDFDLTAEQVIAMFQVAFDSGNYSDARTEFESLNEQGCPF